MNALEAIRTRRSLLKFKPDPPPRKLIETILEMATWAPNHHLTEPWKFFVLAGEARGQLGAVMAEIRKEYHPEESEADLETQRQKALRAPVIIIVAVSPSNKQPVMEVEEIEAGAMAVQNILLAAHSLGLAAALRTGKAAYHPKLKEFLKLSGEEQVLGFIYLGYPDAAPPESKRTSFAEKTQWL